MIQPAVTNVEIDAEGKKDGFHIHVKFPFMICEHDADRVIDEFEKLMKDFVEKIQQDKFWQ